MGVFISSLALLSVFRSITNSVDMNLSKLQETGEDRGAWCAAVRGITESQTRLRTEHAIFEEKFFGERKIIFF